MEKSIQRRLYISHEKYKMFAAFSGQLGVKHWNKKCANFAAFLTKVCLVCQLLGSVLECPDNKLSGATPLLRFNSKAA